MSIAKLTVYLYHIEHQFMTYIKALFILKLMLCTIVGWIIIGSYIVNKHQLKPILF